MAGPFEGLITRAELDRAIGASPEVMAGLIARAEEVQQYWQEQSPVFTPERGKRPEPPMGSPGDYQRSVKIEYIRKASGFTKARVYTTSPMAFWVEYGAAHMPEYAPMAKTKAYFRGRRA